MTPGSGIWISKHQLRTIVTRNTVLGKDPQEMLRQLLKATIGEENLRWEISLNARLRQICQFKKTIGQKNLKI